MCFVSKNANQLTFVLPDTHWAEVAVVFDGENKKRVLIEWDLPSVPDTTFDSCSGSTTPVTQNNISGSPATVTLSFFYDRMPCDGGTPAQTPANNGVMNSCDMTGDPMKSIWTFNCPSSGETTQVTLTKSKEPIGGS